MSEEAPWNKDRLMGVDNPDKVTDPKDLDPLLWGIPGYLTEEYADVYIRFQAEVEKRGGAFQETLYSLGASEEEAWALCRWLRARKFNYDDAITMVEEATECQAEARGKGFYPNPTDALGCDSAAYFAQYPQLYTGFAKNGAPLYISKPGRLNVEGVECLTTLEGIVNFHWYIMIHDFGKMLQNRQKETNNEFKKFECFVIMDLGQLSLGQITTKAKDIIKAQSTIDSLCFPETMSKMILVNVPKVFSALWTVIKGWLDARTASKVELYSSTKSGHKRLLELVDADQLPSDYGGTATDTEEILKQSIVGEEKRIETKNFYVRTNQTHTLEIKDGEYCEVEIFARSVTGSKFSLIEKAKKGGKVFVEGVVIKHNGTEDLSEMPTSAKLTNERIKGPLSLNVRADSLGGRFATQTFLIVARYFDKV